MSDGQCSPLVKRRKFSDVKNLYDCPELKELKRVMKYEGVTTKWYDIGLELLDGSRTVDVIKKNNPNDNDECCTEMFNKWLQQRPDASWFQLAKALTNTGLNTAAKYVTEGMKQTMEQSTQTNTTENIAVKTAVESSNSQLSSHMQEYQEYLKCKYRSLELISPLEMLDCLSTQYVDLILIREEEVDDPCLMYQQSKRHDSVTLAEALDVEGYQKKVTLILGGPGMGKSTLAINICKQWAEGDLLQKYDATVLLLLRERKIQDAKNIKDLLLILDDDIRENVYKEIVKSNGEKICFIFEGYDELPYHLQGAPLFAKLIEELPKCTLVYTTRPEAYHKMPYKGSKVIRIDGFNKKLIDDYISEAFKKHETGGEMAHELKSQVHNNPVVWSILHIPINVAIVCLIFFHFSTLPKTLTELYTKLCLRLILRYINTRTPNEGQVENLRSLDDLPTGISEQFLQLCYIAYKGMENKIIIFSSQDLAGFRIAEDRLCKNNMGLLLITPTFSVAGREKSYNFLHLTLQEFCAAWYISKFSTEKLVDFMKTFHYQKQFKIVWRFYSGITKLLNKEFIDYMLPCKLVKSPLSQWKASELVYFAYEAGSSEVCQIVGDYFKDECSVIDLNKLELHAINYFLTQYRGLLQISTCHFEVLIDWSLQHNKDVLHHSLEDIAVQHPNSIYELCYIKYKWKCEDVKLISQILSSSKTLKVLHIGGIFGSEIIKCLADSKSIFLHDLKVSRCSLSPTDTDMIGQMLSHNESIRFFDFSHNDITDSGVEKLVHHLMNNNTLQHINLCYNNITKVGADHLTKLIKKDHSTLTSIELSNNPLKDKGVDILLQSLSIGTEHIGLCDVQMTSLSCQSLGSALHKVKSISFDQLNDLKIDYAISNEVEVTNEYLEVINNYVKSICTDYWEMITTNLPNTTVLECLEVRLTDVPTAKLINAVGQNKSIKTLKLCYWMCNKEVTYIKDMWTTELAQYVQHSKSLTKLIISGRMALTDNTYSRFIQLLADSLAINTSIKSMVYELATLHQCHGVIIPRDLCEFVNKLKENNTLEELTFKSIYILDEDLLEIENCAQQINKKRNTEGINNLKLTVSCMSSYMIDLCTVASV